MVTRNTVPVGAVLMSLVAGLGAASDASDTFYKAIRNDDRKGVQTLMAASKETVNIKDGRGATPLMYAAAVGSAEMMQQLIAAGADVNASNEFGATALLWCTNDQEKVRLLVSKGADVNAASKQGRTPLLVAAAHNGNIEVVRLLLAKGADWKARDVMQTNVLIQAASANDTAMMRLMLEKKVDVNAKDVRGFTPLIIAAGQGNVEIVKLLLARGADVNAASAPTFDRPVKNGNIALGNLTALAVAAVSNSPGTVRLLLEAGADVNALDVRGMTPLMLAIGTDHADETIIRMILARKPNMEIRSKAGETALDWAVKFGRPSVVAAVTEASKGMQPTQVEVPKFQLANARTAMEAAEKGVTVLQKTSASFLKEGGCFACHAQNMTNMAASAARRKGIAVDQAAVTEMGKGTVLQFAAPAQMMLERLDPPVPDMHNYALLGIGAAGISPDGVTDAMVHNLAAQQQQDGSWTNFGIARPPMADGRFSVTALAIRSLRDYGPPARKAEFDERIARAARWLMNHEPETTEDTVMQLLGAKWAGLDRATIGRLSKRVLVLQREDGGWAETKYLGSDAYATGTALYALHEGGIITAVDPSYRKGVRFLMETQAADGTWHVRSRAPKFQPYFESGFPYGHDQWLSQAGTGWASVALSLAVPDQQASAK